MQASSEVPFYRSSAWALHARVIRRLWLPTQESTEENRGAGSGASGIKLTTSGVFLPEDDEPRAIGVCCAQFLFTKC